jgi:hypothetical protein
VGQNQANTAGTGATLNPFGPGINNGVTVDVPHTGANNTVADTVLTLWDPTSGKVASIHVSNVFCSYGASAITNQ